MPKNPYDIIATVKDIPPQNVMSTSFLYIHRAMVSIMESTSPDTKARTYLEGLYNKYGGDKI